MALSKLLTRQQANFAGLLLCAGLMAFAYFTQYVLHLSPCNMCMLQRICVEALGAVFLLAMLHNPRALGARVYAVLIGLTALVGSAVSARHVWMQLQPAGSLPSCGADFYSMLDMMPFYRVVGRILTGGAECQAITWSLLGLSMPAWLLIALLFIGIGGVAANLAFDRTE